MAICPGGGYVAVGTRTSATRTNTNVYVVRTDSTGWTIWEHTYDILQLGLPDEGIAIVEVSQPDAGFVVLSNTRNGPWSPALTFLKCNGFPGWSQMYRDVTGGSLRGLDLIRTATGDPGSGTAPGDLAVAGVATGSGGNEDAYLMRTNLVGGLVFGVVLQRRRPGGVPRAGRSRPAARPADRRSGGGRPLPENRRQPAGPGGPGERRQRQDHRRPATASPSMAATPPTSTTR